MSLIRSALSAALLFLAVPGVAGIPYGVAWKLTGSAFGAYDVQSFSDVAVCPDGNLAVAGTTAVNGNMIAVVAKVTKTGTVLWTKAVGGYAGHAVAVGADGKVYLGGGGVGGASGTVFIATFDASGNQQSLYEDNSMWAEGVGAIGSIAVNSSGEIFATTVSSAAHFLIRVVGNSQTGNWSGYTGVASRAVVVDSTDNVWVAGNGSTCSENWISRFAAGAMTRTDVQGSSLGGSCQTFNDLMVAPDGSLWAFSGRDVTIGSSDPTSAQFMHVTNAAPPAGIGNGFYAPGLPTATGGACSGGGGMTAATLLSSGVVVGAWYAGSRSGVTGGMVSDACGPGGSFNASWVADLPPSFQARRMTAASGGFLIAAGGPTSGGGPDSERYVLIGLGDAGAKLPDLGKMEIRNNVIHTAANEKAVLVFHGKSSDYVSIGIYGPSGARIGGYPDEFQLDADGTGAVTFDGTSTGNGGIRLGSGVYWIATTQGVHARKPVFIITTSVNPQ